MSAGRTVWRAKDAAWWRREWIVELGEEFGAAGPAVIDWLECEAKCQHDGGWVKAGPRTVARGCFVDTETVSHVVSRSVTLGLLVGYEQLEGRFVCRISWWQADQERGMAASRKAKQRAGHPVETDDPSPLSRSVPECPPTGEDSREQPATQVNTNAELRSAVTECFAYWQERCNHPQAQLGSDRKAKLETRLRERSRLGEGIPGAIRDIRRAIDGAAADPFVDEKGKRFDDIELICRTGSKLEDFMGRVETAANVVSLARPAALRQVDGFLDAPEYQQRGEAG